ncbi:DUF4214 domain-containing protein [Cuneatibacter sp. NSJ-177]|uniref:DUF4214 domain-containing protein n=1 Tax=Cuneatibacter sp. NSJ-177 TaxID=2931401 RepID=UPI001FD132BC|nr:DUF4214 domain-containing protein [Cuneatibacter sp. NSJ-177]MCJ7833806.1 DUF4214 domain-containing protein [Cuneatibacter sp. NSJ-177]
MRKKERRKKQYMRWQCLLMAFLMCAVLIGPAAPAFAEPESSGEGMTETTAAAVPSSENLSDGSSPAGDSKAAEAATSVTEPESTGTPTDPQTTAGTEPSDTAAAPSSEAGSTEATVESTEETTEVTPDNVERIIEEAVEGGEIAAPEQVLIGFSLYTSVQRGTTTANVNYRYQPGTSNKVIGQIPGGTTLTILGDGKDSDGDVWFLVTYNGKQGYVSSSYITLSTMEVGNDAAFEAELSAQGFPESYKQKLRILHAQYPNWKFVAQQAGSWSTALAKESWFNPNGPGNENSGGTQATSLVDKNSIASWKSTEEGAFDWATGQWVTGWDGDYWAVASKELVAYYLDPRNFLDDKSVFQFLDLSDTTTSAATVASVASGMGAGWLAGTYTHANGNTINYPETILNAGQKAGFNPLALCSILIQELGTNGAEKQTISGTVSGYEGYYNYFNIGAYTTPTFDKAYLRGLWIAKGGSSNSTSWGRPWNTREKAIDGGAQYFAEYVKSGQDTLYLKRFDVLTGNYSHQYSTDIQGADSEGRILSRAYSTDLRKGTLTFKIPVYSSMPSSAASMPSDDTNPTDPVRQFVTRLYTDILGRNPDSVGLRDWYNRLTSHKETAAQVVYGFVFSKEYLDRNVSNSDYIKMLYSTILGRNPGNNEINYWLDYLTNKGVTRKYIFAGFINSVEFGELCNQYNVIKGSYTSDETIDRNPDVTAFVTRMYTVCLKRGANEKERTYWVEKLLNHSATGRNIVYGFFYSDEFKGKNLSNGDFVTSLYQTLFDRNPDTVGYNDWVGRLNRGVSRNSVVDGFVYSVEFNELCNRFGITR